MRTLRRTLTAIFHLVCLMILLVSVHCTEFTVELQGIFAGRFFISEF